MRWFIGVTLKEDEDVGVEWSGRLWLDFHTKLKQWNLNQIPRFSTKMLPFGWFNSPRSGEDEAAKNLIPFTWSDSCFLIMISFRVFRRCKLRTLGALCVLRVHYLPQDRISFPTIMTTESVLWICAQPGNWYQCFSEAFPIACTVSLTAVYIQLGERKKANRLRLGGAT